MSGHNTVLVVATKPDIFDVTSGEFAAQNRVFLIRGRPQIPAMFVAKGLTLTLKPRSQANQYMIFSKPYGFCA